MPSLKEKERSPFGSLDDFWTKYDTLADKYDKEMLASLNANLEGLLIFAGLFSGVNTAFIIVILGALSANPLDQTNHLLQLLVMNVNNSTLSSNDLASVFVPGNGAVRQNCIFFASLCCSLLAAASAMLAKQWLREYARIGQTGLLEEQARKRAEKFRGAEQWRLRLVVEALPNLLLISLGLFFAGLVDYLWTIDRTVALVVLAFTGVGLVFYGFTVIVGVVYTASPFQTAVSIAVRNLHNVIYSETLLKSRTRPFAIWDPAMESFQLGVKKLRGCIRAMAFDFKSPMDSKELLFDSLKAFLWLSWTIISPIIVLLPCLLIWPIQVSEVDELDASSVIWMTETAPDHRYLLTIAQNIPLITNISAMQLIAHSSAFTLLLSKFTETFLAAQHDHADTNVADAITMARAVACVLLADPERCWRAVRMACVAGFSDVDRNGRWVGDWARDYGHLFRAIFGVCDDWYDGSEARLRLSLGTSPNQTIKTTLDATIYLSYRIQSGFDDLGDGEWVDDKLSSALLLNKKNVDEKYLSCASRTLSSLLRRRLGYSETLTLDAMIELAWMSKADLLLDIERTLDTFSDYYERLVGQQLPNTPTEPPKVLSQTLHFHQHFLAQLQSLYPGLEALVRSGSRPPEMFQSIHCHLSSNIKWLIALEGTALLPAEDTALIRCRDEATAVLERFLVSGGSQSIQWLSEIRAITDITRLVGATCSDIESILRGLLYRYFFLIITLLPPEQQQGPRMTHVQNRSIAPVLTSALQLYIWLYPKSVGRRAIRGDAWSAFSSAFMYMIGNTMGDTRNTLPHPLNIVNHSDMWRGLVTAARRHDIVSYEGFGPSLMWLAETINLIPAENWVDGSEGDRFVQLFTRVIKGQKAEGTISISSIGIWNCDDGMAAGVLFLRAWDRDWTLATRLEGPPAHAPSIAWTSASAIEAFKTWLTRYHGRTTIEITYENIVLLSATIDHDTIFRFAHHALKINPEAAVGLGLHEAAGGLIRKLEAQDEPSAELRMQVERWKGSMEEALLHAQRWLEPPQEDVTVPRRWTGNGLSRVCGTARLDVVC
ncbi:hypothetical protein FRB94_008865 [Tulasnella sp. JGI-2019a]|nr:hypothetical protein FRB93_008487 [Tulasnella sp. JGI-2019a]KAG8995690.1 hypothetical protein FRB94_008865 [Tulasnella sp. JGI-2019a]